MLYEKFPFIVIPVAFIHPELVSHLIYNEG